MLKVGLTGGIGSGKSTVARIFEALGIPVYHADEEAKRLMNTDSGLKKAMLENFGEAVFKNGDLDRPYLASLVFRDQTKLNLLNSLVHPRTIRDASQWISRQTSPYVIKEAALLFESGAAGPMDYVIGVYAPEALRIKRVMDRNNLSRDKVLQRIHRQMDENIKMKLCNFILRNDEKEMLLPQVLALHQKLLQLAER